MTTKILNIFVLVNSVLLTCDAYIFHPNFTIRYKKSNYFGYSVLLQADENSFRVIVGDPKNDSFYFCSGTDNNCILKSHWKWGHGDYYELLGATIGGGDSFKDNFAVCSPRYSLRYMKDYRANGRCDIYSLNFTKALEPLRQDTLQIKRFNGTSEYFYAHGQAGFSLRYIDEFNEFVLGAPGCLAWKGTIIIHDPKAIDTVFNPEHKVERYSYLGYSVEYGIFPFRSKQRKLYVAGAPRGSNYKGEVLLLERNFFAMNVIKVIESDQLGSYFGATLLVVTRGDYKLSDLIVGAPTYSTKTYEEGCVFVYSSNGYDISLYEKICGSHMGGRFGSAMSKLGDINEDYYEDIAISAPYEDEGRGAIYIYMGSSESYVQGEKVTAESIDGNTRGFGFSLSNDVDIDNNYSRDIAVGAYLSSEVIILKSRAVLKFSGNIYPDVDKIDYNTKRFSLPYCISYNSKYVTGEIHSVISVSSDDRVNVPNNTAKLSLRIGTPHCEEILIQLKSHAFDSPLPLSVQITSKLDECMSCPVAYPIDNVLIKQIPFVTGCGEDEICRPNLKINAYFESRNEYVFGSNDTITFIVNITNIGDPAYLCKLNISLPTEVSKLPQMCLKTDNELRCDIANNFGSNQKKSLRFELDVKNLDISLQEIKIHLVLDSSGQGEGKMAKTELKLPLRLISQISFHWYAFSIPVYLYYSVEQPLIQFTHECVLLNTGPSPLINYEINYEMPQYLRTSKGTTFSIFHTETDLNECTSDLQVEETEKREESSAMRKTFQKRTVANSVAHPIGNWTAYRKFELSCENKSIKCEVRTCFGGQLNANSVNRIKVTLTGNSSYFTKHFIHEDIITTATNATVITKKIILASAYVHTTLHYRKLENQTVSLWVWIVSTCGATIILMIITLILYKVNFFSRPMRRKLKNEEDEIIEDDQNSSEETAS